VSGVVLRRLCFTISDHVAADLKHASPSTTGAAGPREQLLEATLDRELAGMDELTHAIAMFTLGDLRAELTMLARWNLASLDRRAELTRFVRREANLLPKRVRTKLVGGSHPSHHPPVRPELTESPTKLRQVSRNRPFCDAMPADAGPPETKNR